VEVRAIRIVDGQTSQKDAAPPIATMKKPFAQRTEFSTGARKNDHSQRRPKCGHLTKLFAYFAPLIRVHLTFLIIKTPNKPQKLTQSSVFLSSSIVQINA
jgi:hypothetical protein